jgi:hypothetical protein
MRARASSAALLGAAALIVVAVVAAAGPAAADEAVAAREEGAEPQAPKLRWHGSTFSFDQSVTTQTVGLGADYQSYDPVYEWWFAFRPRYFLYEKGPDAVSLNLWANLYYELTNSDTTTKEHELLLGPTFLWASYGRVLRDRGGYKTTATIGPRLTLPTDKGALDSGLILGLGATAGASQTFPLRRGGARFLRGGRLGFSTIFTHPFARSQSPVNSDIHQLRQDLTDNLIVSDVLRGAMNTRYTLNLAFSGELQVMRRLDFSASYVLINRWVYPVGNQPVTTLTGPVVPMSVDDPQTFGVSTWLTASLGYELFDELSVSLGYYNLASQIGPDGTRRSPLWSPSARAFLTLTGNLDFIYQRVLRRVRGGAGEKG